MRAAIAIMAVLAIGAQYRHMRPVRESVVGIFASELLARNGWMVWHCLFSADFQGPSIEATGVVSSRES